MTNPIISKEYNFEIFVDDNGEWRICAGNAVSRDTFDSFAAAVEAANTDSALHAEAADEEDYYNKGGLDWD